MQQRCGVVGSDAWIRLADAIERLQVKVELCLFLHQAFHQRTVLVVWPEATQQQLGIGPQGCQWVSQLVHHQIQLIALLIQLVVQASAFQFEAKDAGERVCAHLQARGLVALLTG